MASSLKSSESEVTTMKMLPKRMADTANGVAVPLFGEQSVWSHGAIFNGPT